MRHADPHRGGATPSAPLIGVALFFSPGGGKTRPAQWRPLLGSIVARGAQRVLILRVPLPSFFDLFRTRRAAQRTSALPRDIPPPLTSSPIHTVQSVLTAYGVAFDPAKLDAQCAVHDGFASIDDVETVARRYGVPASQQVVPPEHVLLRPERFPVIAVVRGSQGEMAFCLLWRIEDGRVQLQQSWGDGVQWEPCSVLEARLHRHEMKLPEAALSAFLRSAFFTGLLQERLHRLGVDAAEAQTLLDDARHHPTWRGVAALDAAVRHIESKRVLNPSAAVRAAFVAARAGQTDRERIPSQAFFVREGEPHDGGAHVVVRGAVVLEMCRTP